MSATPAGYFDAVYSAGPDPWRSGRWYERRKRALLLASLPQERYRRAVEPGCGPGLLTVALAGRCDAVDAVERSPVAADAARAATAHLTGVRVRTGVVPADWPDDGYDLVVLSELGYYTDSAGWAALLDRAVGGLDDLGTLVAVHWRHPAPDHVTSGDAVQAVLDAREDLACVSRTVEADFVLAVHLRAPRGTPGLSVAVRSGVAGAAG